MYVSEGKHKVVSGPLPTFLIIGAAKCGTTALYEYLRQHPDVYMSPLKEPRFFALENEERTFGGPYADIENKVSIRVIEDYYGCFEGVEKERAIGEASTLYLYHPSAPANIKRHLPDAKLIAILRDPVQRAYSGYLMHLMQQREKISFQEALADEPRRIKENWIWGRYIDVGHYAKQLQRYLGLFEREQLKVVLFDDLKTNANALTKDIFSFIDVDPNHLVESGERHNVSGVPKNRFIDALVGQRPTRYQLSRLRPYIPDSIIRLRNRIRRGNLERPDLDPETRRMLLPHFREDILWLQDFLDRDLSAWLKAD